MDNRRNIKTGAIAAIFAALCCATPLLIVAVGTAGLTAWLAKSAYVLVPALLIGLGLVGLWLYRHRAAANAHRDPVSHERGAKL